MRCLYCGKELALFKRLRGGEFCSDAHRQRYQEEYTQLALNRLLQANAPKDSEPKENDNTSGGVNGVNKETRGSEPESPALRRRERTGREGAPPGQLGVTPLPLKPAPLMPAPLTPAPAPPNITAPQTAVLEPEPALAQARSHAPNGASASEPVHGAPTQITPAQAIEEPVPAGMSGFLVEFPVPMLVGAPAPADTSTHFTPAPALALPRLQEFHPDLDAAHLDPAERVALSLFPVTDFPTPPRERGLELREFVRGGPQVEIQVRPAVESGFAPVTEPLEVSLVNPWLPYGSPALWLAPELDLSAAEAPPEILLGELARLDFALTEWGEAEAGTEPASEPASEPEPADKVPLMAARLPLITMEPMRVEPVQPEPEPRPSSSPEPLHFEPVHIDPVFMEKIAGAVAFEAAAAGPEVVQETVAEPGVVTLAEPPAVEEPAVEAPTAQQPSASPAPPPALTKPLPVTLHGLAPMRGKPVQVFTSAAVRTGDLQIPRETGLPLRPIMVLGSAPKAPAAAPNPAAQANTEPAAPPAKSIPIPDRGAPRPEGKTRRAEVRVLPIQVKEQVKPESIRPASIKPEPSPAAVVKPEPSVPAVVKPEPAQPLKSTEPAQPAESPKPAKTPVEIRAATPVPAPAKRPSEEMDLLGLPKLSLQQNETFWSRLPAVARLGLIAAALAAIVGGVVLTSRGPASTKPATPVSTEPVLVEEPALANTAGWAQDWFADRAGSKQGRHVDVLRGSLTQRDYRLVFEGQIESGALGWVFRAAEKSFYVEKIQVVTPGREPVVALVRFAVINGQEQPRVQVPLSIHAHLDTMYKVRMDVVGDRFTTWVQDEKVDQWTDGQLAAGGVGLYYDAGDSAKLRDTLNVIPLRRK